MKPDLSDKFDALDKQLSTHEAVCAERYQTIIDRFIHLERVAYAVAATMFLSMGAVVLKSLFGIGG